MSDLFRSTHQQIARDRTGRQAWLLLIPSVLMVLWGAWMYLSRISVYASTDQARVEVAQTAFIVQAPISGRVVKSHLVLGGEVRRGSVLVELEAEPQQLRVDQEKSHHDALEMQVSNLREQIATEQATLLSERGAGDATTQEALADLSKAQDAAGLSRKEADQKAMLLQNGLASKMDAERAQVEFKEKSSELLAARQAVAKARRQQAMQGGERKLRIQALNKEIAEIEGELAASESTLEQLQHELGAHQIIASGDGHLGEVAPLRGSFVREGDRLAAIVPNGLLRVVAGFPPSEAIGRVRKGQKAWLRLDGFPAAEYGPIIAHVVSVGNEVRDGRVQVDLALQPNPRIPLQHGLPGELDVEVDRISPASYLLRKAADIWLGLLRKPQPTKSRQASPAIVNHVPPPAHSRNCADLSCGLRAGLSCCLARGLRTAGQLWPLARGLPDFSGRHLHRHHGTTRQPLRAGGGTNRGSSRSRSDSGSRRSPGYRGGAPAQRLHAFRGAVAQNRRQGADDGSDAGPGAGRRSMRLRENCTSTK